MLIANINTVYNASISGGGVITSNIIGAWSTTISCNGTVVGKTSNIIGAWITTKNCNGTVTGDTSNIIGAWSTVKDC